MPTFIPKPTQIESAGNKPKIIQEFIGHVNSQTAGVSVAKMRSPSGWVEPGQTPEFDEYTVVLAAEETSVVLPFENGERELMKYPQKRALIRVTSRPPQLETPFAIFNDGAITPNDAFFVRYHLGGSPPARELLTADAFRVQV